MLGPAIISACERHAARLRAPVSHLLAFVEVESNGQEFDPETGKPLIRWEGHYFWQRLEGHDDVLREAEKLGLAAPRAGAVPNPRRQAERYHLLHEAHSLCERHGINPDLAYECVSIGLGQVMGVHWRTLGYESAADMLRAASAGADAQIETMVRYLEVNGLVDALRDGRWADLARAYNGPAYAQHGYDRKLAEAATRYGSSTAPDSTQYPTLRFGASGPFVTVLQNRLNELGYPVGTRDGEFGPTTRGAVLSFQADHGLRTDGVAGPATWTAMEKSSGRPIGARRANATAEDLRREGSSTIKSADAGTIGGIAVGGAGAVGTAVEHLDTAERGIGMLERVQRALWPFWDTISEFLPLILIGVGGVVVWQMYRIKKARVEDHRKGRHLGR